jgi:hypothetical protein
MDDVDIREAPVGGYNVVYDNELREGSNTKNLDGNSNVCTLEEVCFSSTWALDDLNQPASPFFGLSYGPRQRIIRQEPSAFYEGRFISAISSPSEHG